MALGLNSQSPRCNSDEVLREETDVSCLTVALSQNNKQPLFCGILEKLGGCLARILTGIPFRISYRLCSIFRAQRSFAVPCLAVLASQAGASHWHQQKR